MAIEEDKGERSGKGLAVTTLIIGTISFIFSVIYLILVFSGRIPSAAAVESGMIQRFGLF